MFGMQRSLKEKCYSEKYVLKTLGAGRAIHFVFYLCFSTLYTPVVFIFINLHYAACSRHKDALKQSEQGSE